ncbi:MAG TPA: hypothetical protein VFB75_22115 [Burkholderiales bacterium]|nr:hypothetical protein [Burkholderiales bacterium]
MRSHTFEDTQAPLRVTPVHRDTWLRTAAVLSLLWAASLCMIAVYEYVTVDPWTFIGENRGPIFFSWSEYVPYTGSFSNIVLAFDASRFWTTLLAPVVVLTAFSIAIPELIRRIRWALHAR